MLSEKSVSRTATSCFSAMPIGGLRMIDGDQADDKIVAVLEGDAVYGRLRELAEVPPALLDRLRHYFLTYKLAPGAPKPGGRDRRHLRPRRRRGGDPGSRDDYDERYAELKALWAGVSPP